MPFKHENWEVSLERSQLQKRNMMLLLLVVEDMALATAYYLAKEHNITNVAIIEKGWIGGGNVGRNTTIIRSNYMHDDNATV